MCEVFCYRCRLHLLVKCRENIALISLRERKRKMRDWWNQMKNYSKREKLLLFFVVFLSVTSLVFMICLLTASENNDGICYTPQCIAAAHHIFSTVDQTADPCEDFYKFACGNFLKHAIENNQVSLLKTLDDRKTNALKQLVIEDRSDERNLTISFRNQRKFFRACMNTSAIEKDNDKTFLKDLDYVLEKWPLPQGYNPSLFWPRVMVRARERGVIYNFFLDIDANVDLNTSTVYLEMKPPSLTYYNKQLWRKWNVEKILEIPEYSGSRALEVIETMEFAEHLNKIIKEAHEATENFTIEEQKTTIARLSRNRFPRVDWLQFLKNVTGLDSLKEDDVILWKFNGEEYFMKLYYLLLQTKTRYWANYIVMILVTEDCQYLSKKVRELCEDINPETKGSTRKDYCFEMALSNFEGVAEAQYIRKSVTQEKREHINDMIDGVKRQMKVSLKKNTWMDEQTKDAALDHLQKITAAVGWTDVVFNETEFERLFGYCKVELLSENIIQISHLLNRNYYNNLFQKIKEPFSFQIEHELSIPGLEANALYYKYLDVLILIAPILQQPLYDLSRPQYLNYGALGSIIGHELTHAFAKMDEESRQIFANDTLDFWTNETHQNYDIEKECVNEEYENYAKAMGVKLENSSSSMDENLADFARLNLAYRAYQKWVEEQGVEKNLPGIKFTPNQLFWIMASTYMCKKPKLKSSEEEYTNPEKRASQKYALASFRVVGPIRNSPYFSGDFGCKSGQKMNPVNKCRLFI